jgi:metallo-beta-lactamase class B
MRILTLFAITIFSGFLFGQNNKTIVAEDIEVTPISENILLCVSYYNTSKYRHVPANGLLVKTEKGIVIIDTPWNNEQADVLNSWIEKELGQKVIAVIVTHSHADCAGGLGFFNNLGISSYGLDLTKNFCIKDSIPYPSYTFSDSLSLKVANVDFVCYYPGAGHAADNIVVWIENENTLFAGCLIKALSNKGMGNTVDADIQQWPLSVENVYKRFKQARVVIPGHGAVGGIDLLLHTMKIFEPDAE